jgi:hypothetical protein
MRCRRDRKAIEFPDREERQRVLGVLWTDKRFLGMPRDYAGSLILVVPARAVPLLRSKGFTFKVRAVVPG